MQIELVNIIAACALILPTATAGVLGYLNNSKGRQIKALKACKENLSELLAKEKDVSRAAYNHAVEDLQADRAEESNEMMGVIQQLEQRNRALESAAFDLQGQPLRDVKDEDLAHVVKLEVQRRVVTQRQATLPWGIHAHKLATAVGGACFRVVDHCKRGHGEFQAYGPYAAPKADSTAELEG